MNKFLVVLKREYAQVVKKKAFVIGIFLTPVIMGAFVLLPTFLASMKSSDTEKLAVIDQSGVNIAERFSESLEEYLLDDDSTAYYSVEQTFYVDSADLERFQHLEDSLKVAVSEKLVKFVLVVKPDAHQIDSNLYMITNSDNFTSLKRFEYQISNILSAMRLEQSDVNLGVDSVLALTHRVELITKDTKGKSIPFVVKYFSALLFVGIMFGMILNYGQLVMRSIIEEKNSRIMEVLVSSVSPFQLMFGKIVGLGAATFTQVSIWFIIGMALFFARGSFDVDPAIARIVFDPVILVCFVLFLTSGYLMYSTIFALVGSIVSTEKEAQSFIMPVTIMMVLPMMVGISVVQDPNSTMATVLSMIPFTAPTMMMMRVAFVAPTMTGFSLFSGIVGEALISFFLVVVTVIGLIWLTSKIFRIGILMHGKRPTLPEILKWIKY